MSVATGVAMPVCLVSNAHCCLAPSIWRRLLMHAFICAVVRALTKLGMAIAAKRPIMATTIMISTSVNPNLWNLLIFIIDFYLSVFRREQRKRRLAASAFRLFTYYLLQPDLTTLRAKCQSHS